MDGRHYFVYCIDMLTVADKKYLNQTFATKHEVNEKFAQVNEKFAQVNEKFDEVNEKLERLIFTVESLRVDHEFVVHHSSEHFEKNEQQDHRLDRIEKHLNLPTLAV